jgi:hypothetical protein
MNVALTGDSLPTIHSLPSAFRDEFYDDEIEKNLTKQTTIEQSDNDAQRSEEQQKQEGTHLWTVVTICWIFRVPYFRECLQILEYLYLHSILPQLQLQETQRDQYLYVHYNHIEESLTQSSQGWEMPQSQQIHLEGIPVSGGKQLLPSYYYSQQRQDLLKGFVSLMNEKNGKGNCLYIEKALSQLITEIPLPITHLFHVHIDLLPHFTSPVLDFSRSNTNEKEISNNLPALSIITKSPTHTTNTTVTFVADNFQSLPTLHHALSYLLTTFTPRLCIDIYCFLLNESRIIFHSQDISKLTVICEGYRNLLYPLHWTHVYLPVVPIQLIHLLEAPVPFLLGFHTQDLMNYLQSLGTNISTILHDIIIVNCDTLELRNYYDGFENMNAGMMTNGAFDESIPRNITAQRLVLPLLEDNWLSEALQCIANIVAMNIKPLSQPYYSCFHSNEHSFDAQDITQFPSPMIYSAFTFIQKHQDLAMQLLIYDLLVHFLRYIPDCLFYLNSNCLLFNRPLFLHDYTTPEYADFLGILSVTNAFHELTEHFYHVSYYFFYECIQRMIQEELMYWNAMLPNNEPAIGDIVPIPASVSSNLTSPNLSASASPRIGVAFANHRSNSYASSHSGNSTPRGTTGKTSRGKPNTGLSKHLSGVVEESDEKESDSLSGANSTANNTMNTAVSSTGNSLVQHKKQIAKHLSMANLYQQQHQTPRNAMGNKGNDTGPFSPSIRNPHPGESVGAPLPVRSSPSRSLVRAASTLLHSQARNLANRNATAYGGIMELPSQTPQSLISQNIINPDSVPVASLPRYSMNQDLESEDAVTIPLRPPNSFSVTNNIVTEGNTTIMNGTSDAQQNPFSPIYPRRLTNAFQQLDQDFFETSNDSCDYGEEKIMSCSTSLDFGITSESQSTRIIPPAINTNMPPSLLPTELKSPINGEIPTNILQAPSQRRTYNNIDYSKFPAWVYQGFEYSHYYDPHITTMEQLIAYRMSKYIPYLNKHEKHFQDSATASKELVEAEHHAPYELHIPLEVSVISSNDITDRQKQWLEDVLETTANEKLSLTREDLLKLKLIEPSEDEKLEEKLQITESKEEDLPTEIPFKRPILEKRNTLFLEVPQKVAAAQEPLEVKMNEVDETPFFASLAVFDSHAVEQAQENAKIWNIDALHNTLRVEKQIFIQLLLATEGIHASDPAATANGQTPIHQILSKHYQHMKQQYNHQQISFLSSTTSGDSLPILPNQGNAAVEVDPQVLRVLQMIMTMQHQANDLVGGGSIAVSEESIRVAIENSIPALQKDFNRHAVLQILQQVKRDHHHHPHKAPDAHRNKENHPNGSLLNHNTVYPLPEMILENLSQLFYEILQICQQQDDFSTAYTLLEIGGHFFQIKSNAATSPSEEFHLMDENELIEFLSEKIQHHQIYQLPIFWKYILDTRLPTNKTATITTDNNTKETKERPAELKRRNSIGGNKKQSLPSPIAGLSSAAVFAEIRGILYMMLEMGVSPF